ncbi:MAG: hypothetical protein QW057_06635 [Candidatus Bathyarchaeia archaeon]
MKHIVGRVHHPQTRGKVERLYRTLRDKARFFPSMEECVKWCNELKPHLSLGFENVETPKPTLGSFLKGENLWMRRKRGGRNDSRILRSGF